MTTPDLTTYHVIHRALRAGARDMATAAATLLPHDRRRAVALAQYWRGYAGELRAHHQVEDAVFFPALVARVPEVAAFTDRTGPEHEEVEHLLDEGDALMPRVAAGEGIGQAAVLLTALADHLDEHLSFEDAEVLPLFERHFDAEEYHELDQKAVDAIGIGKQAAFTVPFAIAAATDEERASMLAGAPLPLKLLWWATRRRHARLAAAAFVPGPMRTEVSSAVAR